MSNPNAIKLILAPYYGALTLTAIDEITDALLALETASLKSQLAKLTEENARLTTACEKEFASVQQLTAENTALRAGLGECLEALEWTKQVFPMMGPQEDRTDGTIMLLHYTIIPPIESATKLLNP